MNGKELRRIRTSLGLDRLQFAVLLGYTGTPRNNEMRVRRYERADSDDPVPLYIARFVWMIDDFFQKTGSLPEFPDWAGYEFDHSPDPGHERVGNG